MIVLTILNIILAALFTIGSFYQLVYLALYILRRRKNHPEAKGFNRYAVLIAARNEEDVIGYLIDSIRDQDYPSELVDIYVIADNCSDNTAAVAEQHGARVFIRHNLEKVGKGYALDTLIKHIKTDCADEHYDGYFVFDADNLIDKNYIKEMNKAFSNGHKIVTSYRNTKNYGDNWITAGYGLYFLREAEQLNSSRQFLGLSCFVSGTGYLFADELLGKEGEWRWFCLTEDLEFTADMISSGEKVAYCRDAILYDEQPITLMQSLHQRCRWIRGYFQVIKLHGKKLVRGVFTKANFACYDMLMNMLPLLLTAMGIALNIAMLITGIVSEPENMWIFILSASLGIGGAYFTMFAFGALAAITERKRIRCTTAKKILYVFTFPFFIFSFCISVLMATFGKVEWKPIKHNVSVSISDITK